MAGSGLVNRGMRIPTMTRWTFLKAFLIAGGLVATVLPIYRAAHQTTSEVSDALRERYDSSSKGPIEPPRLVADVLDARSTVRRHQLLGPETATPRRWVNDAQPDRKRPDWKT
jgi:hypothetical protein